MRISKKAEYALRALVTIARQNKSWRIEELSARENIPIKYLEQILLALRHAGILTSKRGVGGGYALVRAASRISVGEIIRIFDGPVAPVPCAISGTAERCSCPDPRYCAVRLVMTEITRDLTEALNERTIDEMVRLVPATESLAFEI
jgi:Rrf2 family protein